MVSAMVPKTLIFLCRVVGFSFLSVKKYLLFALEALVLTGSLNLYNDCATVTV